MGFDLIRRGLASKIKEARQALREHWPTLGIVTTASALVGYILGLVL